MRRKYVRVIDQEKKIILNRSRVENSVHIKTVKMKLYTIFHKILIPFMSHSEPRFDETYRLFSEEKMFSINPK